MTPEEIEETIDYLLNEVPLPPVVIVDFSHIFWVERSMKKTLLVIA